MKSYYKNALCFIRCKPSACIPKELEPGMFELRAANSVTVLSNKTAEIALDIMILSPVQSYAHFTLSSMFTKLGLVLLNPTHLESYTGTVTLHVKNFSKSNVFIKKSNIITTMTVIPKRSARYFCLESFELTRAPHELNKFYDVCKSKEENNLFKI